MTQRVKTVLSLITDTMSVSTQIKRSQGDYGKIIFSGKVCVYLFLFFFTFTLFREFTPPMLAGMNDVFWYIHPYKTRRSENDNTPQPLDQWTNSPFMGQQVGNCKSFTLAHSLANLFAMHCDPRESPSWIRRYIQLASLLYKSINLPIPKIWLLKIWPWKSKVKVMGEVKVLSHNLSPTSYRLTFFWFHVNSPSYCYDKAFFLNLAFKIQGESHSS